MDKPEEPIDWINATSMDYGGDFHGSDWDPMRTNTTFEMVQKE